MDSGCSGCNTENWCGKQDYTSPKSGCPCYSCLIKVVCLSGCENYNDWMIKAEHDIKRKRGLHA